MSPDSVLVVTPTYNERDNLPLLVAGLKRFLPEADLLVVDDGSPDGTGDVARDLQRRRRGLHLLQRSAKQGLGAAYRAGFQWALAHRYRRIVQMDADLSHRPATCRAWCRPPANAMSPSGPGTSAMAAFAAGPSADGS